MVHEEVLIPTDGSETANAAVKEAIRLAKSFDATLHVLYVLNVGESVPDPNDVPNALSEDTEAGMALHQVQAIADEMGYEKEMVWSILRGPIAESILDYASDREIDLIVMGTEGRTGLKRLIIGSVTEEVVRESPVPVVTVRAQNAERG